MSSEIGKKESERGIPCENCIVLAKCRAEILSSDFPDGNILRIVFDKCSMLREFIIGHQNPIKSLDEIEFSLMAAVLLFMKKVGKLDEK